MRRRSLPAGDGWLGTRIDIRLNHGIDAMALGYPSVTRNLRSSGSGTLLGHATVISRTKEVPNLEHLELQKSIRIRLRIKERN